MHERDPLTLSHFEARDKAERERTIRDTELDRFAVSMVVKIDSIIDDRDVPGRSTKRTPAAFSVSLPS